MGAGQNCARRRELVKDFQYINLYLERLISREHCELPEL
jgi:hypothetical protein